MGVKRKRRSTVATKGTTAKVTGVTASSLSSSKRSRLTKPSASPSTEPASRLNILSLPPEILDQIITYTISDELPTEIRHGTNAGATIPTLLTSSILQVCQLLRCRAVSVIRNACVWIKVTGYSRDALRVMEFLLCQDGGDCLPLVLGCYQRTLCGDGNGDDLPNTIHLRLDKTIEQSHIIQTRRFKHEHANFLSPYNHDSFLRLSTGIRACWANLKTLTVSVSLMHGHARETWLSQIKPALEYDARVAESVSHNPSIQLTNLYYDTPQDTFFERKTGFVRDLSSSISEGMRLADDLRQANAHEEADLWLLYNSKRWSSVAQVLLPGPCEWVMGENSPDVEAVLSQPSARNALGNQIRSMLVRVQYESCIGWWKLFQKYGKEFVRGHYISLAWAGCRWTCIPRHSWFGTTDQERAQIHYCYALSVRVRIEVYWIQSRGVEPVPDAGYGEDGEDNGDGDFFYDEVLARAMAYTRVACVLDPGNETYDGLLEWFWQYADSRAMLSYRLEIKYELEREPLRPEQYKLEVSPAVTAATGLDYWIGQWWMIRSWVGDLDDLVYLPMAQKMPDKIQEGQ